MPSTEFLDWCAYLDEEPNRFHREDFFFAMLAREVRAILAKDPKKLKLEHFLLKFESVKAGPKKVVSREDRIRHSQSCWLSAGGTKMPDRV